MNALYKMHLVCNLYVSVTLEDTKDILNFSSFESEQLQQNLQTLDATCYTKVLYDKT